MEDTYNSYDDYLAGGKIQTQYRFPKRRFILSVFLFLTGLICTIVGAVQDETAAIAIGVLTLLPGSYGTFALYRLWRSNGKDSAFNVEDWYDSVDDSVPV